MRHHLILTAVICATVALHAQTKIGPELLRETNALDTPPSEVRLYPGDFKGNLLRVRPGVGLIFRSTAEGWVIEAAPVPAPPSSPALRLVRRVLPQNASGHYIVGPQAVIFRNGQVMTIGEDHSHNGEGVLPRVDPQLDHAAKPELRGYQPYR